MMRVLQSDNFTGFTNLMATPLNLRNDNPRINLLAATEDTKPKTYKSPIIPSIHIY